MTNMSHTDTNRRLACVTGEAKPPVEAGEIFFDRDDVRAVYFREANVIALYVDGIERGWWNATAWNQLEIGILVAPNVVRLQQGTFPIVDFKRKVELEPVRGDEFADTING